MKRLPKPEQCMAPREAFVFAGRFSGLIPGPDVIDVFGKRLPKVDFAFLNDNGLIEAVDIYVVRGDSRSAISQKRLESTCEKDEIGWRLSEGFRRDRKFWTALLKTDSPIIFFGIDTAKTVLRALTNIAVYANHSMALGVPGWEVCKRLVQARAGAVMCGIGEFRMDVQFVGTGKPFEELVDAAMYRPQEYFGYTKSHMKELERWKKFVF